MSVRKIVEIDEDLCDGCGLCVPSCAEGAIAVIDGKAKLVSETYCDGLGACLGECPQGAITIGEREAADFNEVAVEEHLARSGQGAKGDNGGRPHAAVGPSRIPQGPRTAPPQHPHLGGRGGGDGHFGGCPGARSMTLIPRRAAAQAEPRAPGATGPSAGGSAGVSPSPSRLGQWPVQLHLVPPHAPYFEDAELLVTADCVPFAYAGFHEDFLDGRALVVGCPKLDDVSAYVDKLTAIFQASRIKGVKVLNMEVPCCFGLVQAVKQAVEASGKDIPLEVVTIGIRGGVIG